ncbi:response regulator transcription factor [Calditerricola satsumensis]|uniref:DNA-binding response regulator n=1 Tax=Calditerricola satsumensis TaxID=373054 RepID=A0A8J3BDQ4_9BACI|nr:response regulator transcription factor [Calditerricola satsumensis]GGJ96814.1 DNA-binding response regulator [Calditerricola satsumensis]
MRILVVDDEAPMRALLRLFLEQNGFAVSEAEDGHAALARARAEQPDLILLDIMLPGLDGWQVCRMLREESDVPIIMLTARDDVRDRVAGLDAGADDYLVKPFAEEELMARIRAVLRRAKKAGDRLRAGPLVVDLRAREASCHGRRLALTPKEFDLLALLARHPGQVFDREQLIERVWGWDYEGDVRTVDTHVKALRAKLEEAGCMRDLIETVRGVGYRFAPQTARPGGDRA